MKDYIIYYIVLLYYNTIYKYYMYKVDMLIDSIKDIDDITTVLHIINKKTYKYIPKSFKYNIINNKYKSNNYKAVNV